MEEFVIPNDTLEEVFENREQIEISKFYERLAKPHSIAIKELEDNQIYVRREEKVEDLNLDLSEISDTEDSDNKPEVKSEKKAEEKTEENKPEDTAS